jgi:hypothetical protein
MARKLPVPEIPPLPSRPAGGGAGSRLPTRTALPKRSRQPELPDLLEAFWGDEAGAGEVSKISRSPADADQPGPPPWDSVRNAAWQAAFSGGKSRSISSQMRARSTVS